MYNMINPQYIFAVNDKQCAQQCSYYFPSDLNLSSDFRCCNYSGKRLLCNRLTNNCLIIYSLGIYIYFSIHIFITFTLFFSKVFIILHAALILETIPFQYKTCNIDWFRFYIVILSILCYTFCGITK